MKTRPYLLSVDAHKGSLGSGHRHVRRVGGMHPDGFEKFSCDPRRIMVQEAPSALCAVPLDKTMSKVLVTGMSGTGKSSALQMLGEKGHRVVDTDTDQWSEWITEPDRSQDWIWREKDITSLLTNHRHGHLFVAGCKNNQGKFYRLFDHIALLSAPAEVLLARIATRTGNPYGKQPAERALILRHLAEVEPLLRATATVEIDAAVPLSRVVRRLEDLVGVQDA